MEAVVCTGVQRSGVGDGRCKGFPKLGTRA
jgi:hypothetical protein